MLSEVYKLYPSPIYTLIQNEEMVRTSPFAQAKIHTSFLQHLPYAERYYRYCLPFFTRAIEQFDLNADLILSCSHAVAKGVRVREDQLHICYCFTPMRYAWDLYDSYVDPLPWIQRFAAKKTLEKIRQWDLSSLDRVDHFVAISHYIAERIFRIYGKESTVIYPPVHTDEFFLSSEREGYYITSSRLVPYKKVDIIVEAFSSLPSRRLLVIGDGPEMKKIRQKASANVELLGWLPRQEMISLLAKAKAFVFAAEEDFGISVVEAQAAGVPVLAYEKGGALETVEEKKTGLFFSSQTPQAIIEAVKSFEKNEATFDPSYIQRHAKSFSVERFRREFSAFVARSLEDFYEGRYSRRR